jgi:hypothetical protein
MLLLALPALINAQVFFQIVIRPDNFPNDISWELARRSDGAVLGRGTQSAQGTIPATEYLFSISDSFGDGICCANGQGSFDLRASGANFFTSDGQYGTGLSVEFTLNDHGTGTVVDGTEPTTPTRAGDYDIELVAADGFNPSGLETIVDALFAAAERWEEVITGDLPDINGIDDLRITYDFSPIDGRGGTIGSAGPRRIRQGSLLPYEGVMTFDSADVGSLSSAELEALFLHEMGHVLGIGTLWRNLGCSQCEQGNPRYNPTGQCPAAEAAFEATPNVGANTDLLIEQDGGQGTACGHFDETLLQSEVMTGFLTVNRQTGISELSTITIGTLQDMGYTVNFDVADDYVLPTSSLNANIILDLSGDMDETEMEMDYPDEEMDMEMDDLNEMIDGSSSTGLAAGVSVGAAAVVGLGAVVVYRRRKRSNLSEPNHIKLVETAV